MPDEGRGEVSRTFTWRNRNDGIAQRAREILLDYAVGPNQHGSTEASLRRYFDAFAAAAARRKRIGPND